MKFFRALAFLALPLLAVATPAPAAAPAPVPVALAEAAPSTALVERATCTAADGGLGGLLCCSSLISLVSTEAVSLLGLLPLGLGGLVGSLVGLLGIACLPLDLIGLGTCSSLPLSQGACCSAGDGLLGGLLSINCLLEDL